MSIEFDEQMMEGIAKHLGVERKQQLNNGFLTWGRDAASIGKLCVGRRIDVKIQSILPISGKECCKWILHNQYGWISNSGHLLLTEKGRQYLMMELI